MPLRILAFAQQHRLMGVGYKIHQRYHAIGHRSTKKGYTAAAHFGTNRIGRNSAEKREGPKPGSKNSAWGWSPYFFGFVGRLSIVSTLRTFGGSEPMVTCHMLHVVQCLGQSGPANGPWIRRIRVILVHCERRHDL